MRKRLLQIGLALLILMAASIGFVHTPIAGDLLLSEIAKQARAFGWEIEARSLRLDLFRLSARIEGLTAKGKGLRASLAEVEVDLNRAISAKHIALDGFALTGGEVRIDPALFAGDEAAPAKPGEPAPLPEIDIAELSVKDVQIHYADTSVPLDVNARDLSVDYDGSLLAAGFNLPPITAGDRNLPGAALSFAARTSDFFTYEGIDFQVTEEGGQARLKVTGSVERDFQPNLAYHLAVEPDLIARLTAQPDAAPAPSPLDGLAPVTLTGQLDGTLLQAKLETALDLQKAVPDAGLAAETVPLTLTAKVPYREARKTIPVTLDLGAFGASRVDLVLTDEALTGESHLTLTGISGLLPQLATVGEVKVKGHFSMPQLDPEQLAATTELAVKGRTSLQATAEYRDKRLTFEGDGRLSPRSRFTFSGSHDEHLTLKTRGSLAGIQELAPFAAIPPELCTDTILFSADLDNAANTMRLCDTEVHVLDLHYGDLFRDHLTLTLDGPFNRLAGRLQTTFLGPERPVLDFVADLDAQRFHRLMVDIDDLVVPLDGNRLEGKLFASGSGAFDNLDLDGATELTLFGEAASPQASVDLSFALAERALAIEDLHGNSAHGILTGAATVDLRPLFSSSGGGMPRWRTEVRVRTEPVEGYAPMSPVEPPRLTLDAAGDDQLVVVSIALPAQTLTVAETQLDLAAETPAHINLVPSPPQAEGGLQHLSVSGLSLRDFQFHLANDRLTASTSYELERPEQLRDALKEQWPADLEMNALSGRMKVESDLGFQNPEVRFVAGKVDGSFQNEPFEITEAAIRYDGSLRAEPFTVDFAGMQVRVVEAPAERTETLLLPFEVELKDVAQLRRLAGPNWPEALELDRLNLSAMVVGDLAELTAGSEEPDPQPQEPAPEGETPGEETPEGQTEGASAMAIPDIQFTVHDLSASYAGKSLHVRDLTGAYDGTVRLEPGQVEVAGMPFDIVPRGNGFRVETIMSAGDLDLFVPGFAGNADIQTHLDFHNSARGPRIEADIRQLGGKLVYTEPWLEFSDLQLGLKTGDDWSFEISRGTANVNKGKVEISGNGRPLDPRGPDILFGVNLIGVQLLEADYQIDLTTFLEWRYSPDVKQLQGSLRLDRGFFSPNLELFSLLRGTLQGGEELYFPDPFMEEIGLVLVVQATQPLIWDTSLGYWETEIPSVVVGGNLAEPIVLDGQVFINEGSVIELGKESVVFKSSQVQFNAARENDPYLQVYLDYETESGHKPITINGYLSELGSKVDGTDLAGIISNFLVGQISSLISLESEFNETIFDSSFTLVVSKALDRRVVTRYALPLNDTSSEQRFELQLGPMRDSYLNFISEEDELTTGLRHQRHFGYQAGTRPEIIRSRRFVPKDLPRWARRGFPLRVEDEYTATRWRHSEVDLRRRLRERGYLTPEISHTFENGRLEIQVTQGPHTEIRLNEDSFAVSGFRFGNDERKEVLRRLGHGDEADQRTVAQLVERMAASQGFPSSLARVSHEGNLYLIDLFTSQRIEDVTLTFGEAGPLLTEIAKDKKAAKAFLQEWLSSESTARSRLRAILAAKGYLRPSIGRGDFVDLEHYRIPVDQGQRGVLAAVSKNGEPREHPLVGKPFEFGFMERIAKDFFGDKTVKLRPRAEEGNVTLDVIYKEAPEPQYDQLVVKGTGRVSEKRVRDFVGFEPGFSHKKLVDAQTRLNETGAYRMVRLETLGRTATLDLRERNRFSAGMEVTYNEENEFGYAVQAFDKMLFKRLDQLSVRAEQTNREEQALLRLRFRRIFRLPVDVQFGLGWTNEREPSEQVIQEFEPFGQTEVNSQFQESREASVEAIYSLTETQSLNAGLTFRLNRLTFVDELYEVPFDVPLSTDPQYLVATEESTLDTKLLPIRVGWVYQDLDNKVKPRDGMLLSVGVDHSIDGFGTDSAVAGTRLLGKMSLFRSWEKWQWTHRLEAGGVYQDTPSEARQEGNDEDLVFFLGGSTNLRGFNQNFAGPIFVRVIGGSTTDPETGEPSPPEYGAAGGRSMFFMSEELTYHTNWYWIELSSFVDTGWVWQDYQDFLRKDMVVTGGFGLGIDSPIGYFRLDWARPIMDDALDDVVSGLDSDQDRAVARETALQEFTFRFGRVF
ncbi:BamA/TamA family outer membrane protein [Sulfidibacter corallicola]|uniref:BamA/TamA family outer membrane protein n=1 Tax=Sulfidibacter corallicola TaxID=2818388 RepID=A0A8A4TXH1_SULCO|nr:BamA/TamA family outer membrane protein [Sulfidibacter corallicola]QTD53898.1 BamA/TamA family outer membrane protein [Sulfidibacter corallicola]